MLCRPREGGDPICFAVNAIFPTRVARAVKHPVVFILASKPYGTLYIGVTSNLSARVEAHRNGSVDGFSKDYGHANVMLSRSAMNEVWPVATDWLAAKA